MLTHAAAVYTIITLEDRHHNAEEGIETRLKRLVRLGQARRLGVRIVSRKLFNRVAMSAGNRHNFRALFARQMQLSDEAIELDRAALYLAGEEYPGLDVEASLDQLDRLASEVRARSGNPTDQSELADALSSYLFDDLAFRGNPEDYYNPDNSFLNRVLETHTGIPITLSVLYLEVGRRLGVACHGVGLPGHFVVGLDEPGLYLDPFHSGELLSAADCRRLVADMFGPDMPWRDQYLQPYTRRDILFRILTNLKHIFLHSGDYHRAIGVIQRLALVNPSLASLHKELAWCHLQRKEYRLAIQDLETYLRAAESPQDADEVRHRIQALWSALGHLN